MGYDRALYPECLQEGGINDDHIWEARTDEEQEQFNNWLNHNGPNKKQLEKERVSRTRKQISEECRDAIEKRIYKIKLENSDGDFSHDMLKKEIIDDIIEIIRGD